MPEPVISQPTQPTLMALDEFRLRVRSGEKPEGVALLKTLPFELLAKDAAGADLPDRTVRIRITTATRDRERDTLSAAGWQLANYRKNPVVLYGHNYRGFPVARDEGITMDELGLIGTPKFVPADIPLAGELAECTYQLIKQRFLNASSVGFIPSKYVINQEEMGFDFLEQELLEYSIVPVPANAEALVEARGKGINIAPLQKWAEQMLDEVHGEAGLWLPRSQVERVLKIATRERVVVAVPKQVSAEWVKELAAALPDVDFKAAEPAPAVVVAETPTPPVDAAATEEPKATDDGDEGLVFELAEAEPYLELSADEEPALGDMLDVDPEELKAAIGNATRRAVRATLFTLTGNLG